MEHNNWSFRNWVPGQNNYFRPHEDGFNTGRFLSPTPESPDALRIHRELPDLWNNIGDYMRLTCLASHYMLHQNRHRHRQHFRERVMLTPRYLL